MCCKIDKLSDWDKYGVVVDIDPTIMVVVCVRDGAQNKIGLTLELSQSSQDPPLNHLGALLRSTFVVLLFFITQHIVRVQG